MFSGVIEQLGMVTAVEDREGLRRMCVRASEIVSGLEKGASVAIDGACHTITEVEGDTFCVESVTTTLSRTIAGKYQVGSHLNLERGLLFGGRVDGHFVQGHVDAVGSLTRVEQDGETRMMDFFLPEVVAEVTVLRGSIAINGVSLTVSTMPSPDVCRVGIIPFTWDHTNLRFLEPGASVNLEGDLIGKHVGKILAARGGRGAS
ncbi:MAG: riboflavin synthase [Gemmatimonadota bacterium]|nr:MAG: riboflavin synthase [Gemmatimonadota bacterium]